MRVRANRVRVLLTVGVALAMVAVCLAVWVATTPWDRALSFTVRDAASKSWVWDLSAALDGRVARRFYQSDAGPVAITLTRLRPGRDLLELTSPSYLPLRVPVTVRGRRTVLQGPIEMVGYEIPGLASFLVFQEPAQDGYFAELRPIRTDGSAVANHPCLDLWVGCAIWVQTRGGAPVTSPTETGGERGQLLFRDRIRWEWDGSPDALFRYHARIPKAGIRQTQAPYLVFDYVVVVPDPRRISSAELEGLMETTWSAADPREAMDLLERNQSRLRYFLDTSWNVERAP